jgi:tetratricopeptide (TPR) repeat protein
MTRAVKTLLLAVLPMASGAAAAAEPLSLSSNFRIGSGGVTCNAQGANLDPLLVTMFDRAYTVVCRDAAAAVGRLYALKGGKFPEARDIEPELVCEAAAPATLEGITGATKAQCVLGESGIGYTVYSAKARGRAYVAAGLAGYDSALQLGLRSLVLDRNLPGTVEVAVTEAGDAAAFARVQAGNLDPGEALAEGYIRNNEGSFAESAEFFETLVNRSRDGSTGFDRTAEYLANQALQQSNLGNLEQSRRLFAEALSVAGRARPGDRGARRAASGRHPACRARRGAPHRRDRPAARAAAQHRRQRDGPARRRVEPIDRSRTRRAARRAGAVFARRGFEAGGARGRGAERAE